MSQILFSLPIIEHLSPSLSVRQYDQLPVLVIEHPQVQAAICLQGAHLIAWQPKGNQPVIWLSSLSPFVPGTAIRGGIPICWPWFGKVASPSHGFARILPWQLTCHTEDETQVMLAFTLHANAETRILWPYDFTLCARFKLGQTCEIELEFYGDHQTTAALHTYFQIGEISNITVSGLGEHYIDKVQGEANATQHSDLVFVGETDRIYTHPTPCSLIQDPVIQRTIEVQHGYNSDVVTWNPGRELAMKMVDMPNDSYRNLVCVETARISQPLQTRSGTPSRLSVILHCRPH